MEKQVILPREGLPELLPASSQYSSWWPLSGGLVRGILSSWVWGHPDQTSQSVTPSDNRSGNMTSAGWTYFVPEVYSDGHSAIQQWLNVMPPEEGGQTSWSNSEYKHPDLLMLAFSCYPNANC